MIDGRRSAIGQALVEPLLVVEAEVPGQAVDRGVEPELVLPSIRDVLDIGVRCAALGRASKMPACCLRTGC